MLRTMFRGKGLNREAPASRFSGYQGEASSATSWVHKLDHRDSWPPHPLQASLIIRLRLPSRSPLRGALSLFLSGEALTSLSFHLTLAHDGPFLSSPLLNQPGVDPSSSTRTDVLPNGQRLYAVSRRSHICIAL